MARELSRKASAQDREGRSGRRPTILTDLGSAGRCLPLETRERIVKWKRCFMLMNFGLRQEGLGIWLPLSIISIDEYLNIIDEVTSIVDGSELVKRYLAVRTFDLCY